MSVCRFCDAALEFTVDGGGGLRHVSPAEIAEMPAGHREEIGKVQRETRQTRRRRN